MWYFIKIWIICNSGTELLTPPEHLRSSPVLGGVPVTRSLDLCVWFVDCCFYFVFFRLAIVLSVLWFTHSYYHIRIFKLFLHNRYKSVVRKKYRKQCKNYNKYPILIRSQFVSTGLPDTDLILCDTTCFIRDSCNGYPTCSRQKWHLNHVYW